MIGNKITLKFVFSIHLNVLKNCFDILSRILFACLFVSVFFFSVLFELYCFRFRLRLLFEFVP